MALFTGLAAGAGAIGSAALGAGGILGAMFGGGGDKKQEYDIEPEFLRSPMFPEAEAARQNWWERLQQWGGQPGYGAIAPNWQDIWGMTKRRVSQAYWGAPGGEPGLAGKVRASAARRGVAQGPALETELTRMGMGETQQLQDLATQQAMAEAQFGETGRQNWMQQLMGLAGQRVPGAWTGGVPAEKEPTTMELLTTLGAEGIGLMGQQGTMYWYEKLLSQYFGGGGGGAGGGGMPDFSQYTQMPTGAEVFGGGGGPSFSSAYGGI